MIEIPTPIEDIDFFAIKRIRYELHVDGTFFITADEECDDFGIDPAKIDLGVPIVVDKTVVGSEERCIDDPTKPFDRKVWVLAKRIELGDNVRPHEKQRPRDETTLGDFIDERMSVFARIVNHADAWRIRCKQAFLEVFR